MINVTDYADAGQHGTLLFEVISCLGYFLIWNVGDDVWELYNNYEEFANFEDPIVADKYITNIAGDLNIRLVGMCQYTWPRQEEWCIN